MDLSQLEPEAKRELLHLLEDRQRHIKYNKLEVFKPYPFQERFYEASHTHQRRFLCAANR
jgi:hypothetical protein